MAKPFERVEMLAMGVPVRAGVPEKAVGGMVVIGMAGMVVVVAAAAVVVVVAAAVVVVAAVAGEGSGEGKVVCGRVSTLAAAVVVAV